MEAACRARMRIAARRVALIRWGRFFLLASGALVVWAAAIAVTGGFRIDLGAVRLSSHGPGRVLLLAVAAAAIAWRLAYRRSLSVGLRRLPPAYRRLDARLRAAMPRLQPVAVAVASIIAIALLACGLRFGSRVAGGADAFGYVSASVLWAHGLIGLDLGGATSLPSGAGAFVPLAYRLGQHDMMGPTVAPGLPLLMAGARLFSSCAPYLVMPLCGSLLVLLTFELGRRVFSTGVALAAALLVACSPVVLFQSLVVMADVPAAAFWTAALTVALTRTSRAALASGVLSGIAILIRPNLAPLAVFPWLLLAGRGRKPRPAYGLAGRTASFAVGTVPAALFIAWVNDRLYGSPFSSGYGDLGAAFALEHARSNLSSYARWWLETQGPLAFLFVIAIWRRRSTSQRDALVLAAYAACATALYAFYLPFDEWWYLRFLVPAIPVAFLLSADVVDWATSWSPSLRALALCVFVAFGVAHAVRFIASKDIVTNSVAERRRYLDAARFVDSATPPDAIVLAMQHSGSVRYYSGRLTMRWDVVDPGSMDAALSTFRDIGLPVYALLEDWEEQDFRRRFTVGQASEALTIPIARSADDVRLYALGRVPATPNTAMMPRVDDRCIDVSPGFIYPDAARRLGRRPSRGR